MRSAHLPPRLDPATGAVVGEVPLPSNTSGGLTTYVAGGEQYVAIPFSGASQRAGIVALKLKASQ